MLDLFLVFSFTLFFFHSYNRTFFFFFLTLGLKILTLDLQIRTRKTAVVSPYTATLPRLSPVHILNMLYVLTREK